VMNAINMHSGKCWQTVFFEKSVLPGGLGLG